MNPLRWMFIAAASLSLLGCASVRSGDPYRPLHRQKAPEYATVVGIFAEAFPESSSKQIKSSLRKLWFSRTNLGAITGYYDWGNYLSFRDLSDSLERFPNNPFAWTLLADYLALEKQPLAAALASEKAILVLQKIRSTHGGELGKDLDALDWTSRINKAIFLNLAGEYDRAIYELEQASLRSLPEPFVRLSVLWAQCVALIGSGDSSQALRLLDAEAPNWEQQLPKTEFFDSFNYPQYFEVRKRKAVFNFLRGEALLRLGRPTEAEDSFRKGIAMDPELWVAQLSLGTALYGQGRHREAKTILTSLVGSHPRKSLYSFDLAIFNLANVDLELGNHSAARDGFRDIVEDAAKRDRVFEKKIAPSLPDEIRAICEAPSRSGVVAEAASNLRALQGALSIASSLGVVHSADRSYGYSYGYYGYGLLGFRSRNTDAGVAVTNVARAQWSEGNRSEAVTLLTNAVRNGSEDPIVREALLSYAVGSGDPNLTYEAIAMYLSGSGSKLSDAEREILIQIQSAAHVLLSTSQAKEIHARVDQILGR